MVTVAEFNRAQRAKSEPTRQQQNQYQQMAQSMADAGIRSLSGRTTDTERGSRARDIQRDFLFDKTGPGGGSTPVEDFMLDPLDFSASPGIRDRLMETKGDPLKQSIVSNILRGKPPRETGIFGINFGNLSLPTINPVLGAIQGFQNTNQVLEKLSKGSKLSSNDKVTLINLVNNFGGVEAAGSDLKELINEYGKRNDLTGSEISTIIDNFNENYQNLENLVEDQQDYLDMYFDRMDKMGLGDTIKTMAGDLTGTRNIEKGTTTLQDLTKPADEGGLGTEGLQFLKVTDPKTYYRLRPNDPDLANVAFTGDKNFDAKIMEARAEAMNRQSRQDANMGQGIMAAWPALPGLPFEPPSQPIDIISPKMPLPVPDKQVVGRGITPFDVRQFYASLPQYTQQGVMSPNLAQYYQNLGLFPGMNV